MELAEIGELLLGKESVFLVSRTLDELHLLTFDPNHPPACLLSVPRLVWTGH